MTDGQSKSDLFTLLLRPSERRHEDAVTRFVNDILRPTRQAWYDPASSEARVCPHALEDHKVSQLRQWAQCFHLVVREEKDAGHRGSSALGGRAPRSRRYTVVAKVRPDDYCE